jgi:GDPmannose 4,6-dehydratase
VRDWSFAGDIMCGAWLMLQRDRPADFILSSGIGHRVQDLVDVAFDEVGLNPDGYVRVDEALVRRAEQVPPVGDSSRARAELGWSPAVSFDELVRRMVRADLAELAQRDGRTG